MTTLKFTAPRPKEREDPLVRLTPLLLRLAVYALLLVILVEAIPVFYRYTRGEPWPFFLWVVRTVIFLPLHEGGHFLFRIFGNPLYALGGSFWQVMFPLLWFAIALKQRSQVAPFPLFWAGENLMDVSLYLRDAPTRVLPLLGGRVESHDWHYLLTYFNMMDWAGEVADLLYFLGLLTAVGGIALGIGWAIVSYRRAAEQEILPSPVTKHLEQDVEETLRRREEGSGPLGE